MNTTTDRKKVNTNGNKIILHADNTKDGKDTDEWMLQWVIDQLPS